MRKSALFLFTAVLIVTSSCVSNKKFKELKEKQQETQTELDKARTQLGICQEKKKEATIKMDAMKDQVKTLKNTNSALLNNQDDLATLSKKGAENLERSLESMREKDLKIEAMRDAINKKDSVTLALVTSLKSALGNIHDEDIQVNVEKGVVFVSISDKLLFKSGSDNVTQEAHEVLGKVAKVVKDKPDFEFMVEGHTDSKSIKTECYEDNWDLSVHRATSIVRILQEEFDVKPARMTAAGRSHYVPVADNDTAAGRAKNRRTRIVVLPKLDQFYNMIEEGMEEATKKSKQKGKK